MHDESPNDPEAISLKAGASRFVGAAWLIALAVVMTTTGIWDWLSPRPDIGRVAVLWLPNAVLMVGLLRYWERPKFCALMALVFVVFGLFGVVGTPQVYSVFVLLLIDLIEVFILTYGLIRWSGPFTRVDSALNVTVFAGLAAVACAIGAMLAALVSLAPFEAMPIAKNAPMQVGVTWFMSDLATYFLAGAPLLALTSKGARSFWLRIKRRPLRTFAAVLGVMGLTIIGFALPSWIEARTGLVLGTSGLIFIAFPLAAYLSFRYGPIVAALAGFCMGVPAIYATMAGIGPFAGQSALESVFDLQASLIVTVFTLLLIGAMAHQIRARSISLQRALDEAIRARQSRL